MSGELGHEALIRSLDLRIRRLNGRLMVMADRQAFELEGLAEVTFWGVDRTRDTALVIAHVAHESGLPQGECGDTVLETLTMLTEEGILTPIPAVG